MEENNLLKRQKELTELLNNYAYHYYVLEKPIVADYDYDVLYDELLELEKRIAELTKIGRPILVGTISIEKSEYLSALLKKMGIKHNVLNAKHHEREAYIIAQAGRVGAVTIATNMAGRGTDILLGGNPEFLAKQKLLNENVDASVVE